MPPYRYDKIGIQDLKDDLRLSEADMQTIVRWVDGGAPQGNPADMPPPRQFSDTSKWAYEDRFGPPDVIVPTKPYDLPAQGQDRWWRPIVPMTGVLEDRCIKAMAVKPSRKGRAAAHHANSDLMVPDEKSGAVHHARARLGIRLRQDRRDRPGGWLPHAAGQRDDPLGRPLLAVRRSGEGRRRRARPSGCIRRITRRSSSRI